MATLPGDVLQQVLKVLGAEVLAHPIAVADRRDQEHTTGAVRIEIEHRCRVVAEHAERSAYCVQTRLLHGVRKLQPTGHDV